MRRSATRQGSRVVAAIGCTLGWVLVAGCGGAPVPCASYAGCPTGQECLANRCVPTGGEPVPPTSERVLLVPVELAVVSDEARIDGVPRGVTLGRRGAGEQRLYLRFPPEWSAGGRIDSAFLLLDPLPGVQPNPEDVRVLVSRVAGDWRASDLRWSAQPELKPPESRGLARTSPPSTLRVDVTELARFYAEQPRADRGLALQADSETQLGVTLATGAGGGEGPRLELYRVPGPRSSSAGAAE